MTRIKLVLAQPKSFVLSELWQVTVAMMKWIINHWTILSGDVTQASRSSEVNGLQYKWLFYVTLMTSRYCLSTVHKIFVLQVLFLVHNQTSAHIEAGGEGQYSGHAQDFHQRDPSFLFQYDEIVCFLMKPAIKFPSSLVRFNRNTRLWLKKHNMAFDKRTLSPCFLKTLLFLFLDLCFFNTSPSSTTALFSVKLRNHKTHFSKVYLKLVNWKSIVLFNYSPFLKQSRCAISEGFI